MGVMGRPKVKLDVDLFEECCKIQCTQEEIANLMRVSIDVLAARVEEHYGVTFSDVFAEKREGGRMSLRRAQYVKATQKDDTIMQIWLGKNILHQADKQDISISGGIDIIVTGTEPEDLQ